MAAGVAVTPWYLSGGIAAANCIAAYQPKGAASYAASKVNLANPGTFDATEGVAPTWDTGVGWTFNYGPYLLTGIVHAQDWSMIVQYSGAELVSSVLAVGARDAGSTELILGPTWSGGAYAGDGGAVTTTIGTLTGSYGIGGHKPYRNGVWTGHTTGAWGGLNTIPMVIGAANLSGSIGYHFNATIIAFAIYNIPLDAPAFAALSAAMAAL